MFWATPLPPLERDVIYGWSLIGFAFSLEISYLIRKNCQFQAEVYLEEDNQHRTSGRV